MRNDKVINNLLIKTVKLYEQLKRAKQDQLATQVLRMGSEMAQILQRADQVVDGLLKSKYERQN